MKSKSFFLTLTALVLLITAFAQQPQQQAIPFAAEIAAFKHQDSISMPKPGGILFVGSSSIRLWGDLESRFADKPIIKRGVGGSEIWQWVKYYAPDLIYPYQAKKVFIYVGENDIAAGRPVQEVYQNAIALIEMVNKNLPKAEVYFMSMKLSPSRAKKYEETKEINKLIAAYLTGKKKAHFIDVTTPLYNAAGTPDSTLFKADYLHLKPVGYDKWEAALKKYVK